MRTPQKVETRIPYDFPLEYKFSNYALNFNGVNSFISVPRSASLEPPNQMTVETWILFRTFVNPNPYFLHKYGAVLGYGIFRRAASNTFRFYLGDGAAWHQLDSTTTISLNTLYHLVATYDGSRQRIYLNGVLDAEGPVDIFVISPALASNLEIGAISGSMPTYNLDGWMDEIRIHGVGLSYAQVRDSFRRGYGRAEQDCRLCLRLEEEGGLVVNDLSGNGNNGSISNATWMQLNKHQLRSRTWQ